MSQSTVTSKGQITIPADVRKAMSLKPGTRVEFHRLSDGTLILRAKTRSALELAGMLKPPKGRKVTIEEMNLGSDG